MFTHNHKMVTKLPIAICYLLATSALAQNANEIEFIQSKTNLKALRNLINTSRRNTLSTTELKKQAQKRNLSFSGNSFGKYYQLMGFDKNQRPIYYSTSNAVAGVGTGASQLHTSVYGLQGEGLTLHEWDGNGVRESHREFGGRVTQMDEVEKNADHATHVAGTMIAAGIDEKATGMAPKAKLHSYDWNDVLTEMVDASTNNGALLSNHSYGINGGFVQADYNNGISGWYWLGADSDTEFVGFGHYGSSDAQWDLLSQGAPYHLPVKAAGNQRGDGPKTGQPHFVLVNTKTGINGAWMTSTKVRSINGGDTGFDCISEGTVGKNILVVGAVEKINGGYKQPSDVKAAYFSVFGPTDDGRIKPDIVGVGVDLYSATSDGDSRYDYMSGTSMASPNVTGSLGLVQEYYHNNFATADNQPFMKSATVKALAFHTANEAGDYDGPDYKFGWGLLNVQKAVEALSQRDAYSFVKEEKLQDQQTYTLKVKALASNQPLKVTIVWDDPVPATDDMPESTLNNRKSVLVNDLDLRISDGTTTYLPWVLDPEHPANAAKQDDNARDNTEQIVINNPVAGREYTITVKAKKPLMKNEQSDKKITLVSTYAQEFSLVATGINNDVTKDLAVKSINIDAKTTEYSANTPISIVVENTSEDTVSGATLKYTFINTDDNMTVTEGFIDLPSISKGLSATANFTLDLTKSFVNYEIIAEVIAEGDRLSTNNKQKIAAYGTLADLTEKGSSFTYGFESPFAKNGWTTYDELNDSNIWQIYNQNAAVAHSGMGFAVNFALTAANDWLFSNPIKVTAGKPYKVEFYGRSMSNGATEPLTIFVGNEAKKDAMTKQIGDIKLVREDFEKYSFEFTPETSGIVYVGINNNITIDKTWVGIDDFTVRYAEGKPIVDFEIGKTEANSYEDVEFQNNTNTASTQPATYEWSFSPNTVEFLYGDTANSENPRVKFLNEGVYSVTLKATNAEGESVLTKDSLITIKNTATVASFKESATNINEGETVSFTNTSTGNPAPTAYKWTITPSTGVSFVGSATENSENIIVKFDTYGDYTITLQATSPHNSDTMRKTSLVRVNGQYEGVKNLKGRYDATTKNINLNWDRPNQKPQYLEEFATNRVPAELTTYGGTWYTDVIPPLFGGKSSTDRGIFSDSKNSNRDRIDVDSWLVTPKLKGGAEILKYDAQIQYFERYDVYIVPAPTSGKVPTVDEIKKAGAKVLTFDGNTWSRNSLINEVIDIKSQATQDFYIAFHHRTLKGDNSQDIAFDNIEVGYDNSIKATSRKATTKPVEPLKDVKAFTIDEGKKYVAHDSSVEILNKEFGIVNAPFVTGYQVYRDGTKIADVVGMDTLTYSDDISAEGTYTYDVYAVYSNGAISKQKTVTVQVDNLSTKEITTETLKIYPNPSDGKFVIDAGNGISELKTEVYDMAGKLIFRKDYNTGRADLDLTAYPKGIYLLRVIDNNGEKHNAKLIIK